VIKNYALILSRSIDLKKTKEFICLYIKLLKDILRAKYTRELKKLYSTSKRYIMNLNNFTNLHIYSYTYSIKCGARKFDYNLLLI